MFVYGNELLLMGSVLSIIRVICTSLIGTYLLAVGIIGFQFKRVPVYLRALYIIGALLLIDTGLLTDLIGVGAGVILSAVNFLEYKKDSAHSTI
jgi:TRAP-type uncharacterized transport system fused permease subunit